MSLCDANGLAQLGSDGSLVGILRVQPKAEIVEFDFLQSAIHNLQGSLFLSHEEYVLSLSKAWQL